MFPLEFPLSLLDLEQNFCSRLARLEQQILEPLLGNEPQDSKAPEHSRLLALLHERFRALRDFTEENSRDLRVGIGPGDVRDLFPLRRAQEFLSLNIQYFVTFANVLVVRGFERAAKGTSAPFRDSLPAALQEPFQDHVRSHRRLLEQLRELLPEGPERAAVSAVEREFGNLESFMAQVLQEAESTRNLWDSLGAKFTDVLCVPERRLLGDSRALPITAGPARSQRLLLFDDVLVLIQGNSFQSFDLKLVWVDEECGEKSAPGSLRVVTPEETFALSAKDAPTKAAWRWRLSQAVRQALQGRRDFPLWGRRGEGAEAPARRFFSYAFRGQGRLRGATYEGEWLWGKPHGKGTLKWHDGRNHVGDFQEGLEHGFGIRLVPRRSEDRYDCYKCHWHRGKLQGYGICEYGNGLVYKGYFKDDLRHGFGVLENISGQRPFKYTGHWERDRKSGYGVWDDRDRGQRYIGLWRDDRRHGAGIVVTHSGLCCQGTFHMDKMVGSGILLREDDGAGEGSGTEELGQGKFSPANDPDMQLGQTEFPVEQRWPGIFQGFWEFLRSGCAEETEEALTGFHTPGGHSGSEDVSCRGPELLQELRELQGQRELQQYLQKALLCAPHPLSKLLSALSAAFRDSFGGSGGSRHLRAMARDEVKFQAREIWEFTRALLALARGRPWDPEQPQDSETSPPQGPGLVLPLLLPSVYPELCLPYLLQHQRSDRRYGRRIARLSREPDGRLLGLLGVPRHLWPLEVLTETPNQRRSLIQDRCFLSAIECLQKLITTLDPREKLSFLRAALSELEAAAGAARGRRLRLPMEELLPLLLFVTARARIQHLGAELHLLRDLMDPSGPGALPDFLLTALESCYEHIQRIRLPPEENSPSS